MIAVQPHPLLDLSWFRCSLPAPAGDHPSPPWLVDLLRQGAPAPMSSNDEVRAKVRDLLRHGGYKPTGRGKPASEYLLRAAGDGSLAPINVVVDACNAASLHSGLPMSVVDADLARPSLSVRLGEAGESYAFNAGGQVIDVAGLLCLVDAASPCANAVKDSQRTKTHAGTVRTLNVVWGTVELPGRAAAAAAWWREIHARLGLSTDAEDVSPGYS